MIDPFTQKMICTDTSLYTYNVQVCNKSYLFNGTIYNTTGSYSFTGMNSNGCDSLVVLQLTVDTINAVATQSGAILSAANMGATYQWTTATTETLLYLVQPHRVLQPRAMVAMP